MSSEQRISELETQISDLRTEQLELQRQLARAERERWQALIDDLEVQAHLGVMEGNDRARDVMDALQRRWRAVRKELDERTGTATDAGAILRDGLQGAVRDVRQALMESGRRIRS